MAISFNTSILTQPAFNNTKSSASDFAKSIERISSGMRINRGADDASGLTVSEKLRGQIRGLSRAMANSQDAISMIQTMDQGLNETSSILQRLRELSVQSQDGALSSSDRLEIQKEVDEMLSEVDRIASTTEFNTKKLLDGTASAGVTVSGQGLKVTQTKDSGLMAGDYLAKVRTLDEGVAEHQISAILTDKDTGFLATQDTKLKDLKSFSDTDLLEKPQELMIRGNQASITLSIDSHMSVKELSDSLKAEITKDKSEGGLGLRATDVSFDQLTGQINIVSGNAGTQGEISLIANEELLQAFGFETITESSNANRQIDVYDYSGGAATNKLDDFNLSNNLQSEQIADARIESTLAPVRILNTGAEELSFRFTDDQGGHYTEVTLSANTSYSLVSVVDIINHNNATGIDMVTGNNYYDAAKHPGGYSASAVTAKLENGKIVFEGNDGTQFGFHGLNGNAFEKLGIYGTEGSSTSILDTADSGSTYWTPTQTGSMGTANIVNGVGVGGGNGWNIVDWDGTLTYNDLPIDRSLGEFSLSLDHALLSLGASGPSSSLHLVIEGTGGEDLFLWLRQDTSKRYLIDYSGTTESVQSHTLNIGQYEQLEIKITQDGTVTYDLPPGQFQLTNKFTSNFITNIYLQGKHNGTDYAVDNILLTIGQDSGPSTYVSSFTTQKDFDDLGYTFDNTTAFEMLDKNNQSSGMISFGEQAGASTFNNVTYSQASISEAIRASDIGGTDIDFGFDEGGRLQFFSKSKGSDSAITINTLTTNDGAIDKATSQKSLDSTFGFDTYSERGWGDKEFQIHVADSRLGFQTGANQSQRLTFGVGNFGTEGLGINGLDMTNYNKSTEALGLLDEAINTVSSARSQLGSLQNRLTSTINNLQVTHTNLSSTESKIRDVDLAKETVANTTSQILQQSGTSMLSQAKNLSISMVSQLLN